MPYFISLTSSLATITPQHCKNFIELLSKNDLKSVYKNAINKSFDPNKITEVEIESIMKIISEYDLTAFSKFDTTEFQDEFSQKIFKDFSEISDINFSEFDSWFKDYLYYLRFFLIKSIQSKSEVKNIIVLNSLLELKKDTEDIKGHLKNLYEENLLPNGVRIIENNLFRHSPSLEEIEQYYNGSLITWDIVASGAIIERDAYKKLVEEWIQPTDVTNLICIMSEAGEGKSSLAWKFIYDLFQKQENLILQIKDFENSEIWQELEKMWRYYQKPFIVLVDNIFRNEEVVTALQNIGNHIPMTILATSRTNEYRGRKRLPFTVKSIRLNNPSYKEKKRILEELEEKGINLGDISDDLLKEYVPFLVFMMEATHGKKFEEIIEDEIDVLKKIDQEVNQAYQYLCFTTQYEISIPKSVLEKINENFYNIGNKDASRGIILIDDIRNENLRTRHPLIATYSAKYYGRNRILINNLLNSIDGGKIDESKFIFHLFREMVKDDISNLKEIIHQNDEKIDEFIINASISELGGWQKLFKAINAHGKISECTDVALSKKPKSSLDGLWLIKFYQEKNMEIEVLPKIQDFLLDNPHDNSVRTAYLGLVKRNGTQKQKEKTIADTEKWLSDNPHDNSVRTAYLGLVERNGTQKQKEKTIADTEKWLSDNPHDNSVRTAYLGLVERNGTQKQKEKIIADTEKWLSENPDQANIWDVLISYLIRENDFDRATEIVTLAIKLNPNYPPLLNNYINLMQNILPKEDVKNLYIQLFDLNPGDIFNKTHYANWLRDHEYFIEAENVYKVLIEKYSHFKAIYGYGCLLLKLERFEEASEKFRETLNIHKGHALAHDKLALSLIELEKFDEAENELNSAIYWAKIAKGKLGIFYHDFGLLYLKLKRFKEAELYFKQSIDEEPLNFANYWHLGETYFFQKQYEYAEKALMTALEKAPDDFGPPASEEIDKLLKECRVNIQKYGVSDNDNSIDQIIRDLNKKFAK